VKRFGRTPRVLFAEDNPTNQFVARELLKGLDIQVDMVGDGLEAVDQASRFAYDVICMDVQMPEMDGLEATRLIRGLHQPFASVPIIALTANAFPEDVRTCLAAGMDQFVAKPVSRETLLNALMKALSESMPTGAPAEDQRVPATATE
jgi:CheY-like chemotaxis protein